MRVGLVLAFAMLGILPVASAPLQEALEAMRGTISVKSLPMRTAGKLTGCTLVYETLVSDHTYRQGRLIRVDGNVGLVRFDDNLGASLKVVVNEVDLSGTDVQFIASPPSRAYIIDRDLRTNLDTLVRTGESDTPGALFSMFQISPSFEIIMAARQWQTGALYQGERGLLRMP